MSYWCWLPFPVAFSRTASYVLDIQGPPDLASSLPFSPSCPWSPSAGCLFMTRVLPFLGLRSSIPLAWSNHPHVPAESYPCFKAPFIFFSRGEKWPNIPSFVLFRHFAFVSFQHCLVIISLYFCLPANLYVSGRQRPVPSALFCPALSP